MLLSLQLSWLSSLSTLRHTDRHLKTTQNYVPSKLTHSQSHCVTRPSSTGTKLPAFLMEELGPSRHSGQGCPVVLEFVFCLSLPPSLPPLFLSYSLFHPLPHHMALTLPETQMSPEVQQLLSRCLPGVFAIYRPSRVPLESTWHQRRTS